MNTKRFLLLIGLILSTALLMACGNQAFLSQISAQPTSTPSAKLTDVQLLVAKSNEAEQTAPTQPLRAMTAAEGECDNGLAFLADLTIPDNTEMSAGESFVKTWRVRNSGTCPWSTSYQLVFIHGEQMGATPVVPLSQEVAPGKALDVSVNLTAPREPGTYYSTWQLRAPDGTLFGTRIFAQIVVIEEPELTQPPTTVADDDGECDNQSAFVTDVTIPDNTEMTPGESFVKTWRLRNSGTCPWNTSHELVFIRGEQMDATPVVPLSQKVAPGKALDVSVNLTAPLEPGTYRSTWQLRAPDGTLFGTRVFAQIVVEQSAAPTPVPTEEPAALASLKDELFFGGVGGGGPLCSLIRPAEQPTIWLGSYFDICLTNFPLDEVITVELFAPNGDMYSALFQIEWEEEKGTVVRLSPPLQSDVVSSGSVRYDEDGAAVISISWLPVESFPGEWNAVVSSASAYAEAALLVDDPCLVPPSIVSPTIKAVENGSRKSICLWDFPLNEIITVELSAPNGDVYSAIYQIEWEGEPLRSAYPVRISPPSNNSHRAGKAWAGDADAGIPAIRIEPWLPVESFPGEWNVSVSSASAYAEAPMEVDLDDECFVPASINSPTIKGVYDDSYHERGYICLWDFPLNEIITVELSAPNGDVYSAIYQIEWEGDGLRSAYPVRISPTNSASDNSVSSPRAGEAWDGDADAGIPAIKIWLWLPSDLPDDNWHITASSASATASGTLKIQAPKQGQIGIMRDFAVNPLLIEQEESDDQCRIYTRGEQIEMRGTYFPPHRELPFGIYNLGQLVFKKLVTTDSQGNFRTSVSVDSLEISEGHYFAIAVTDPETEFVQVQLLDEGTYTFVGAKSGCFRVQ